MKCLIKCVNEVFVCFGVLGFGYLAASYLSVKSIHRENVLYLGDLYELTVSSLPIDLCGAAKN